MKKLDEEYNLNFKMLESEKILTMKNALEIYEFVFKNQNNVISNIENNIKILTKAENEKIIKIKVNKINENKDLENEIEILENKINGN